MLQRILMEGAGAGLLAGLLVIGLTVAVRARNWGWTAFLGILFLFTQAALLWVVTQVLAIA